MGNMSFADGALMMLPKRERERLLAAEAKRRRTGQWGEWEHLDLPPNAIRPTGWTSTFRLIHRNSVFAVLDRMDFSGARHLAVTSLSGIRPTWPEMQRIKDDLAGPGATAVEVYPPRDEIVDQANMYHIWIVPGPLPFSLFERDANG